MSKIRILALSLIILAMIPLTYVVGRDRSGGRSSVRTRERASVVGNAHRGTVRTRIASTSVAKARVTRAGDTSFSTRAKRTGTKVANRGGRLSRHGSFWGHRHEFRGYPGNFWLSGIGYPWWWYDSMYRHICVDRFGFEVDPAFCYTNPGRFFWWYR